MSSAGEVGYLQRAVCSRQLQVALRLGFIKRVFPDSMGLLAERYQGSKGNKTYRTV